MSTIHYNLNTLLDFIQSSNNDQPLQKHLLQLLLVHEGARKAYLLETGNDEFHFKFFKNILKKFLGFPVNFFQKTLTFFSVYE